MLLAINYSHTAAKLVQSEQIEIDYFKTPDWDWLVKTANLLKPVAMHFTLETGNDSLGLVDWDKVNHLSQTTGTPYINLHLDARQSYYPEFSVDTTNPSEVERVFNIILSDVISVTDRFGPERVIIENSPYQGEEGNTLRLCVQPDIITRVVNETGCGLLLDISHAIIAARFLSMKPDEYISNLPMGQLKEMHFSGIHHNRIRGRWMDHLSIQKKDWYWLDWVLKRINAGEWNSPWLLAFEYGGVGKAFKGRSNPHVIIEQVAELNEYINILNA